MRTSDFEQLEARQLLAAVSWDGEAGDNLWHSPANWSTNAVPTASDDVTIDVATNPTVLITADSGAQAIRSLISKEALRFTGGALTLATTAQVTGAFTLNGGTLQSGTWNVAGISIGVTLSSLLDVTVVGALNFASSNARALISGTTRFTAANLASSGARILFSQGYVLRDLVAVTGLPVGDRFVSGSGTLTIGPSGVVRISPSAGGNVLFDQSVETTLVNQGLISGESGSRTLTIATRSFENHGVLQALASTVLSINAANWINTGTIVCAGTSQMTFGGSWQSPGSLTVTGGTLNLSGSFHTSGFNLSGLNHSSGTVRLVGTWDNTESLVRLDGGTGSIVLAGGTLRGGEVLFEDGQGLVTTNAGGVLDGVQIGGDLLVSSQTGVTLAGSTRFGTLLLANYGSRLVLADGFVLKDTVVADGVDTGDRFIESGAGVELAPSAVVSLASSCAGSLQIFEIGSLTNYGVISALGSPGSLKLWNVVNYGELLAHGGRLILGGSWSNLGTISVDQGVLELGGLFSYAGLNLPGFQRSGGTVRLTGNLDNSESDLVLNAHTGSWQMVNGVIVGGTLNFADGQSLIPTGSNGHLRNVQVLSDLYLGSEGRFNIEGSTRFPAARLGAAFELSFEAGYVLRDRIIAEGSAPGLRRISVSTIAAEGVVRLAADCGGDLRVGSQLNSGLIVSEATNRQLLASLELNQGDVLVPQGDLLFEASPWVNEGSIVANGVVRFNGNWTNRSLVQIGSGSTVVLEGNWRNEGVISASSCNITLKGTIASAGLNASSFLCDQSSINITGIINNANTTLVLSEGNWRSSGGRITGGTVELDGIVLFVSGTTTTTLANVRVLGEVLLDTDSARLTVEGSTQCDVIRLGAADVVAVFPAGYEVQGRIIVDGAAPGDRNVQLSGTLTIGPTGEVLLADNAGGNLRIKNLSGATTLVNNGRLLAEAVGRILYVQTSHFTNNGTVASRESRVDFGNIDVTNYSQGTLTGGTWEAIENGRITFLFGSFLVNMATVRLSGPAATIGTFTDLHTNLGTITLTDGTWFAVAPGSGVFTNGGSLNIDATSYLIVTGTFLQTATGVLNLGVSADSTHERVLANTAQLGGSLAVTYSDYAMARGDSFNLILATSVTGTFASTSIGGAQGYDRPFLRHEAERVWLEVIAAADWDGDGFVTGLDYDLFVNLFEQGVGADFDGDGFITGLDFDLFVYAFEHG